MTKTATLTNRLRNDNGGAIMVMGVFMALSLIGSLWFIMGMGEAIIQRDYGQEAADAAAFSSAVVHARGMNMIAALNLVMLAITMLYLLISFTATILSALVLALNVCLAAGAIGLLAAGAGAILLTACGTAQPYVQSASTAVNRVQDVYSRGMKPILQGLSWTQTGIAIVTPYAAVAAGVGVSLQHEGIPGFAFSPSAVPGFVLSNGLAPPNKNLFTGQSTNYGNTSPTPRNARNPEGPDFRGWDERLGLPVTNASMARLCDVGVILPTNWIMDSLRDLPIIGGFLGAVLDISFPTKWHNIVGVDLLPYDWKTLEQIIREAITGVVKAFYCNKNTDAFWDQYGPKEMWGQASNGNDWMQVWAFSFPDEYQDVSGDRVAIPSGAAGGGSDQANDLNLGPINIDLPPIYSAQAEFYFDCSEKWGGDDCNSDYSAALYSVRWRARLMRLRSPNLAGMLGDQAEQFLGSDQFKDFVRGTQANRNNEAAFARLDRRVGTGSGAANEGTRGIYNWLRGEATGALAGLFPSGDAGDSQGGVYH